MSDKAKPRNPVTPVGGSKSRRDHGGFKLKAKLTYRPFATPELNRLRAAMSNTDDSLRKENDDYGE